MEVAGLGPYELLHRIAVGGMGEVFLARQRGLAGVRRLVAVKRLLPDRLDEAGALELFLDEARVAATLAHPNIVQVYELGNDRGTYYLAMELVVGQNLDRLATRCAPLPRVLAVHAVAEAVRGLEYAHAASDAHGAPLAIVHRDVSPQNVLVSYEGDVKLMDFGIARAANQRHRTRTGVVRGKPVYMSPEQLAGEAVDARSDVYAAGVMLWELTLGRRRSDGGELPAPRSIDPAYPEALEQIVMAAVRPGVADRTADAATLGRGLREWLATTDVRDARGELGAIARRVFADEARAIDGVIRGAAAEPAAIGDAPTAIGNRRGRTTAIGWAVGAGGAGVVAAAVAFVATRGEEAPVVADAAIAAPIDALPDAAVPDAAVPDAAVPIQPPPRPRPPVGLAARLKPESLVELGIKFRVECAHPHTTLPARVTFELKVDKLGRVKQAVQMGAGAIETPSTRCMRAWITRWKFEQAERDEIGTLSVTIPARPPPGRATVGRWPPR